MSKLDDILEDYDDPNANVIEESRRIKDLFLELIGDNDADPIDMRRLTSRKNAFRNELREKVNDL